MGRAWRTRRPRGAWAGVLLALPAFWGCASPLVVDDGGFRNRERGWWVAEPSPAQPPWQRGRVKGAILSYHRPGPIWMSLQVRCKIPLAKPAVLARHLRIGLGKYTMRESRATSAGAYPGWAQVFDVSKDGTVVRVKTVTLLAHGCAFDWVLTAHTGRGFATSLPSFDAWWHSLRFEGGETRKGGAS